MKRCVHCGKENRDEAQFCGHCGRQSTTDTPKQPTSVGHSVKQVPNPRTATLLSFLWPGLGQIYNGQIMKGAAFAVFHFFLWTWQFFVHIAILAGKTRQEVLYEALNPPDEPLALWEFFVALLIFFGPPTAFWVYGMIDAKLGADAGAERNVSPRIKLVPAFASGIIVGILLTAAFLTQTPESSLVSTAERLPPAKTEPKAEETTLKGPDIERPKLAEVDLKTVETAREVPATESPKPAKIDSKTEEAARRKLEHKGIAYSESAFRSAIEGGNREVVELFLAAGMSPSENRYGSTSPLMIAADKGHTTLVQILLANGANVNAKEYSNQTALMMAAEHGHTAIVQILLDKGADVSMKDSHGYTALALAAKNGHTNIVRLLDQAKPKE